MMNRSALFSERGRWGLSWLLVCIMLLLTLLWLLPRSAFTSSVLALLPQQTMGEMPPALTQAFMQRLDSQLIWLVSPDSPDGNEADSTVAQWWLERLQALPGLSDVKGPMTEAMQREWGEFYWQHRNGLIDPQTRRRLQNQQQQADWVVAQLYSAFAGVSAQELTRDPLLLVRSAQLALQQGSALHMERGWLVARDEQGRRWYVIHGASAGAADNMQQTRQLVHSLRILETALQQRWPDARLLTRGTLFYSDYASQQALHDIATLGTATLSGVLLLIFYIFRSLYPLLLCLLSIGIGALAGTVATLLIFGELHLMTLLMSISIVGISADYALYWLTERRVHGNELSTGQSLHKLLPTLLLALGTQLGAYLIMLLAPLPGLRQLAVFAAAGLIAACLTVLCWFPCLTRRLAVRPLPLQRLMAGWLSAWQHSTALRTGLPLAVTLFAVAGLSRLSISDDISQLQDLPAGILQQERHIVALTGQRVEQKWFAVYGASPQSTLQRLEQLAPRLADAQHQGWLSSFRLLPLSSLLRQQADLTLLRTASPAVLARLAAAGMHTKAPDLSPMPVTPEIWQQSVISEGWRLLWLTLSDGQSAVLVPVDGVRNAPALAKLADEYPGLMWIDRKAVFDKTFAFYRTMLSGLLLLAVAAIFGSYVVRLGWRRGLLSMVPSLLSLGSALAILAFSGHSLNLFSLLALVLVLGLGINYSLFFSNPRAVPLTSLLAIVLAMATTLLTLGMLVFSSTQAISSFGIVLSGGIFTAFLLSPLAIPPQATGGKESEKKEESGTESGTESGKKNGTEK